MCSYNRRWTTWVALVALCAALIVPISVTGAPVPSEESDRAGGEFSFQSVWTWILNALQPASEDGENDENRLPINDFPSVNSTEGDGDGDGEVGPGLDPIGGS